MTQHSRVFRTEESLEVINLDQPYLIPEMFRNIFWRLFGGRAPHWVIMWRQTFETLVARFLFGLLAGGAVCFLLIPVLLWPPETHGAYHRTSRARSVHEMMGNKVAWLFAGAAVLTLFFILCGTRAVVRRRDEVKEFERDLLKDQLGTTDVVSVFRSQSRDEVESVIAALLAEGISNLLWDETVATTINVDSDKHATEVNTIRVIVTRKDQERAKQIVAETLRSESTE